MLSVKNINIIKRHYKVVIFDNETPVDYCFSNTLNGVLDYVNFSFNRLFLRSHNLSLTFKIIRYEFGDFQNSLAEDLPTA